MTIGLAPAKRMTLTYQNPVYAGDFADPFVLRTSHSFYAYGTAPSDGRLFPVLRSADLVHWTPLGGALVPLQNPAATAYWAPEVAQRGDHFYMFYSAATSPSDDSHRLRVAVAHDPAGPFVDTGQPLLPHAGFSIDASPFCDPATGKWYLFFATDYETDEPQGTGLAAVTLADDLLRATSDPQPILRAYDDTQIYERNRIYKGRLWEKWHCIEGPHCLAHNGKYFLFFSGGTWRGSAYGVSYAQADHPLGPWRTGAGGHPTVLKANPGKVDGPGHSCCVLGPDDQTLFMVYHAWDPTHTQRRMCIDPLLWPGDVPLVDGPSSAPRQM